MSNARTNMLLDRTRSSGTVLITATRQDSTPEPSVANQASYLKERPNRDRDDLRTSKGIAISMLSSIMFWLFGGFLIWLL